MSYGAATTLARSPTISGSKRTPKNGRISATTPSSSPQKLGQCLQQSLIADPPVRSFLERGRACREVFVRSENHDSLNVRDPTAADDSARIDTACAKVDQNEPGPPFRQHPLHLLARTRERNRPLHPTKERADSRCKQQVGHDRQDVEAVADWRRFGHGLILHETRSFQGRIWCRHACCKAGCLKAW